MADSERKAKYLERYRQYKRRWDRDNQAKKNSYQRTTRARHRRLALEHYSGREPCCACCGESRYEFLTIDHIAGGGNRHRAEIKHHGQTFYRWLKKNGWPDGYRVLCMNCNHAIGMHGYCPHERERAATGKEENYYVRTDD